MLSLEFRDFYKNWLAKAERYEGDDIGQYFDKFFTLYIVYNRLYAETTFLLARNKKINLSTRDTFPDAQAAQNYVIQFLGASFLIAQLEQDIECNLALSNLINLIESEQFHIKLDMIYGNPQPYKDKELLAKLKKSNKNERANAILEAIYSVRCNMFHGHKGFQEVQKKLLIPIIKILESVIRILYEKLASETSRS